MSIQRKTRRFDGLEAKEDLTFQERSWRWEMAGQIAVVLLILAGLAGLFGGGPLSEQRLTAASGGLRADYPRWVRNHSAFNLQLQVAPRAVKNGRVEIWIGQSLLQALQIESVSPEPEAVELGQDRLIYRFRVADPGELAPIVFHAKANGVGSRQGRLGLLAGETLQLRTFIHP